MEVTPDWMLWRMKNKQLGEKGDPVGEHTPEKTANNPEPDRGTAPTPYLMIQKDFYVQCAKDLIKRVPDWFEERQMPMKHIRKGIAKRGSMTRAYSAGAQKIAENMYLDCHVEGYLRK